MSEPTVEQLLADAARDYAEHNTPERQAEARIQLGLARIHGNEAASTPRGNQ
ncbi:hypothetical protein [Streptomyces niveiscabiei]|uniref:hypothetical protein n=1 Tax=Streptomyces niveiscabiei TaxID=164115 RepID=UPI0038F6D6F8